MESLFKIILANVATFRLAHDFMDQQNRWILLRDGRCADGSIVCLTAQYDLRNLALQLLMDRGETTALTDVSPVIMKGTWSVPDPVEMLSAADNPLKYRPNVSLDSNDPDVPNFPGDAYLDWSLPLPGTYIVNSPNGQTCFHGRDYMERGSGPGGGDGPIPANRCYRFGWQLTKLNDLPKVYGNDSLFTPTLLEADLHLGPDSTAFIGYPADIEIPNFKPPGIILVEAKDGSFFVPVQILANDDHVKTVDVAYQHWIPVSKDAGMQMAPMP